MDSLDYIDTQMSLIQVSRSIFQRIQVDGSFLLQGLPFICIFLSMGMCVWPIFGARLLRSLWNFRRWIPSEKSHRLDYSLGLFGAIVPKVIFHGGVMRHVDPTWHSYVVFGYIQLESSTWNVGHVILSSTFFISIVLTLRASLVIFAHLSLGGFHTIVYHDIIFLLYILWDVVISIGKGNLYHVGPLPSIICIFYVMLSLS